MTSPDDDEARAFQAGVRADSALPLYSLLAEDGTLSKEQALDAEIEREAPPWSAPSPKLLLRMYRELLRVRLLDTRMVMLQRQGRIGFYGASTGQEAVPVAAGLALAQEDWVFPALRENAIMLVRGFPLPLYLAQIYGNKDDVLKGRQMPSHMSSRAVNQVSWSSCIGTQIPHAVGAAWAAKLKGDAVVSMGFMGDGATSEADFHAGMNFAAVFRVPVVLVCQNNQFAISVPASRQTASVSVAVKARAYGMAAIRADGNDVLGAYRVLSLALARARSGKGPTFVEFVTYRVGAHSTSDDPTRYRSQEEVDEWTRKDPVDRLQKHLESVGLLSPDGDAALRSELEKEIVAAVSEVERAGPPDRAGLFEDVYSEKPWHLAEEREALVKNLAAR